MRESNAIDFWRGFALVNIYINHVPGNVFARDTYPNASLSDAAELFVFLAGWAVGLATRGRQGYEPPGRVVLRLASRTVEVYRAQITITAIALAMIAGAALAFNNPVFLEWHNAGPVFSDPLQTTIGWVTLAHQLGYFNILPLYVVLLAMAPGFVLLARLNRKAALVLSVAICGREPGVRDQPADLAGRRNVVLQSVRVAASLRARLPVLRVVAGFEDLCPLDETPDAARRPRRRDRGGRGHARSQARSDARARAAPALHFHKSNLSPGRLLHFLALLLAFQSLYRWVAPGAPWLMARFSAMGRNSLAVFSMGSIVSLAGQMVRFRRAAVSSWTALS